MTQSISLAPPPGSRIVIAGGAGGIGRQLVQTCRDHEHLPIVLDLPASLEAHQDSHAGQGIGFDGGDPASIEAAVAEVGRRHDAIDAFVFLSGFPILPRRPLLETDIERWDELMAVNLRAAYLFFKALVPLLREGNNPAVVSVASSLAYQVMPGMSTYAASKGALVSLTKGFAMENAPKIRANVVAPGAVDTDFLGGGTGRSANDFNRDWFDQLSNTYVAAVPLARVAEPADIVGPIMFLLGHGSSYMTGQVLHVNGGRLTP